MPSARLALALSCCLAGLLTRTPAFAAAPAAKPGVASTAAKSRVRGGVRPITRSALKKMSSTELVGHAESLAQENVALARMVRNLSGKVGRLSRQGGAGARAKATVPVAELVAAKVEPSVAAAHAHTAAAPAPDRRGWLGRLFTVRPEVAKLVGDARARVRDGDVAGAAESVVAAHQQASGLRERVSVWWSERAVRRTGTRELRKRSAWGDALGARDALKGLDTLRAGGTMGLYSRWRAAAAEKRAFGNALTAAIGSHELEAATENLLLAADLRRIGSPAKIVKRLMGAADRFALEGKPEHAIAAANAALRVAGDANLPQDVERATEVVREAFRRQVPTLIYQADELYGARRFDEAAMVLNNARAIQESSGGRPGYFSMAGWKQRRLTSRLGPRLRLLAEGHQLVGDGMELAPGPLHGVPAQPLTVQPDVTDRSHATPP